MPSAVANGKPRKQKFSDSPADFAGVVENFLTKSKP
jgi:hypothetical protein